MHINRAAYGSQGHGKDGTIRLKALVCNKRLDVIVDNDTMGGDPNEHSKKTLKVDYTFRNRSRGW